MTILLDFETQSKADLKKVGGRRYAEHASTVAICAALYDTKTGARGIWINGQPKPFDDGDQLGAHNWSGFDRFIAQRLKWVRPDYRDGVDTSEAARRAGLPGALDALGTRWLDMPKDKAASRYVKSLSRVKRPSSLTPDEWKALSKAAKRERGILPKITDKVLSRAVPYAVSDTDIMGHGWPLLRPWLDDVPAWENDVLAVDRIVNDRGIAFDVDLARALIAIDERAQGKAFKAAARVTGMTASRVAEIVNAPAQFCDATGLPNAQAKTIDAVLAAPDDHDADVVALCKARRAVGTIAAKKCAAGLARVSAEGRLQDSHRYIGAHTWRWSGVGFQSQNIPRPEERFEKFGDDDVKRLVDRAKRGEALDQGEIDTCLRATHMASPGNVLVVHDFSGIEARCLAWMAGDDKAIEVFTIPGPDGKLRNVYLNAASQMFGVPYETLTKKDPRYTAGKMGELACGYQGGVGALERIAANYGVSFDALGVDPQAIVDGWRKLHAPSVRFWRLMQDAFMRAADGHRARVRLAHGAVPDLEFMPSDDGQDVAIFLPSGRPIVYGNVVVSRGKYGPEATYAGTINPVFKCMKVKRHEGEPAPLDAPPGSRSRCLTCGAVSVLVGREKLYGGLLTENVVQAFCRDLLARSLVKQEEAGLSPVLHVHDEAVGDVPKRQAKEAMAEQHRLMTTLPKWARKFPIGAAGHFGERYRK